MPIRISFPYQFKIISGQKIPDPVVYLNVVTSLGIRKIGFLVDSGSDTVVLPLIPYQFLFQFKPNPKTQITLGGVEGKGVIAYQSQIAIQIGSDTLNVRCHFVRSDIMPLLGRVGIWDRFNWIFDNQRHQVIFERI